MKPLTLDFIPSPVNYQFLFRKDYLTVYYNATDNCIYADWTGFVTDESIREGSELLLQAIKETKTRKLINDNTHLSGIKANVIEWLATDFAPRLEAAGLQYLSWIYKTDSLTESSADSVLRLSQTDILVIVFDNVAMAEKWLRTIN